MAILDGLKRYVSSDYFLPVGVYNAGKNAVQGNFSDAAASLRKASWVGEAANKLAGTVGASYEDVLGGGGSGGPGAAAPYAQDRDDARALYEKMLSERGQALPTPPQVTAGQVAAPAPVQMRSMDPVERVTSVQQAPAERVTAPTLAPVERVQAGQVSVAPLGQAQQAGWSAIQGTTVDTSGSAGSTQAQGGFLAALQDAAAGRGPSVAQSEYEKNVQGVADEQLSIAAGARGNEGTFLKRQAMRDVAKLKADSAAGAAVARAHEITGARTAGAGLATSMRSADDARAALEAQFRQQAATSNQATGAQAEIANASQANAFRLTGRAQDIGVASGNRDAALAASSTNAAAQNQQTIVGGQMRLTADTSNADRQTTVDTQNANREQGARATNAAATNDRATTVMTTGAQIDTANADRGVKVATGNRDADLTASTTNANNAVTTQGQQIQKDTALGNQAISALQAGTTAQQAADNARLKEREIQQAGQNAKLSSLATGASMLATMSDARAKEDIAPESSKDVSDFLGALKAVSYRYRSAKDGPEGERHGILAQDLEKSKIGKSVVKEGPDGKKRVDTAGLTLALAGVLAHVAKEKRMSKKEAR